MGYAARMRRLLGHAGFRRLLGARIVAQCADGVAQVGMLAYAVFSPTQQPTAWAVVGVLAVTLLPFSLVAPVVSAMLDWWPRQRTALVCEAARAAALTAVAGIVAFGGQGAFALGGIYALLLVAMSLNRFILAGLAAGMADVVDEDEYLAASSLMPLLAPFGLITGGLATLLVRVSGAATDAPVFLAAALFCLVAVRVLALIGRDELGPPPQTEKVALARSWSDLAEGLAYLKTKTAVVHGLAAVGVQRLAYGALTATTIVGFRNRLFVAGTNEGIYGAGGWFLASGVGFLLSGAAAPWLARRFGLRNCLVGLMFASACFQVAPGSWFRPAPLMAAALLLGVAAQSAKVLADTLAQGLVDDAHRGRVFMVYDIMNNTALVAGAALAAVLAPPDGLSLPFYIGLAGLFAATGLALAALSRRLGTAAYEVGFEKPAHQG